ncbi:LANO_0G16556g1_1 [Lachancea nothofagi CBS 11611]|uniref:LANO_0G16556g1_1 n=1 Tax=Lachancea nothofagi CBS 11611 TaxID=1266666 RepID=A0A1G4KKI9_9SACH|nr:LANO_0G16556g1_1 [Lachancea nothofagi CBS 11611]
MADCASSAGSLSKKLRSKDVSTAEIYDISIKLLEGEIAAHFPKREVFILDLLVDRWNNQRNTDFKCDPSMWQLFNKTWATMNSDTLRKKIFKNLKYVPHLIQTLEMVDAELTELAGALATNFELLNSCLTVDMAQDQAIAIIAGVLKLVLASANMESDLQKALISETLKLTIVNLNTSTINFKLSSMFCMTLLPNILKYNALYQDNFTAYFSKLLAQYLFAPEVDSMKLMTQFLAIHGAEQSDQSLLILFRESIKTYSKTSIIQLEQIFTLITGVNSSVAAVLLQELCSLKKTLSQPFLETLFNKAFDQISGASQDNHWILISKILRLDIEVGIMNTVKIMDKLSTEDMSEITLGVWGALIECYVNAREVQKLLVEWKNYSTSAGNPTCFVDDFRLSSKITRTVPAMSVTQLKDFFNDIFENIAQNEDCSIISFKLLNVIMSGLYSVSYNLLPNIEPVLLKMFEFKGTKFPEYWTFTYHFLNIYDDIFPEKRLCQIESMIMASLETGNQSSDLFLTIFKVRELKHVEMDSVVTEFMTFLRTASSAEQRSLLDKMLSRWCTIVNLCFPQGYLSELIDLLLLPGNIDIMVTIAKSDEFFEEDKIMHTLINKMCEHLHDETILEHFSHIPIQCVPKVTRIKAVDLLCQKQVLSPVDMVALTYLLSNPTFKSSVEMNVGVLEKVLNQDCCLFDLGNSVVERVLANHTSQLKEATSERLIGNLVSHLNSNLNASFNIVTAKMVFLLLKAVNFEEPLGRGLETRLIDVLSELVSKQLNSMERNLELLWSLRVLYDIHQGTKSTESRDSIDLLTKQIAKKMPSEALGEEYKAAVFSLYCFAYRHEPKFLLAHYMVLRQHMSKKQIYGATETLIVETASDFVKFNDLLAAATASIRHADENYADSALELLGLLFYNLQKENAEGRKLFARSLSELHTYMNNIVSQDHDVFLGLLDVLKGLLVWKPWLFSQHTIETLFPFCLRANSLLMELNGSNNDNIVICTSQLLSHILLYHRFKFTSRHHLIISYMCSMLEMFAVNSHCNLSFESAEAFSRLITIFCEPSSDTKNNKSQKSLQSQVSQIKKFLRRHVSVLLLKYISLAISSSFSNRVKESLSRGVFSVFDVMSQAELSGVNLSLDNPGRVYFKALYAEYKRTGKWHED